MHSRVTAVSLAAAMIAAAACGSDSTAPKSNVVKLSAAMTPGGEVGATLAGTTTASTGTFSGTLDTVTNVLTYTVVYSGLSSNVTAGHIHGPFTVGQTTSNSAGVILNFDPSANANLPSTAVFVKGGTSGNAAASITLSSAVNLTTTVNGDSLKKLILAGKTYANIHTSLNQGGEVRGQIAITP